MFLFFSGMDCKSSNNANKKLVQGKIKVFIFQYFIFTQFKGYENETL